MNKTSRENRGSGGMPIWLKTVAGVVVFGLLMVAMIFGTGILNPEETADTGMQFADLPPNRRAEIAWERRNWKVAEGAFREMIEADQFDGLSVFNLGYCLHEQEKLDEAAEMYRRAADYVDYASRCHYNLACIHALQGRPDEAIDALSKAIDGGLDLRRRIQDDKDLVSLHNDPKFLELSLRQFINREMRSANR